MADTPKIPFPGVNRIAPKMELKDVLDLWKRDLLLNFNCHHVGTIQGFDAGDATHAPTVQATINYKKTLYKLNTKTRQYDPTLLDYPLLIDMPVIIMSGGTAALTMPIAVGDECIILFNDRDIDNWFAAGQIGALQSNRLHSFSDGIALVGLRSNLHPIEDYDTVRAVLRNDNAYVGVGPQLIKIANDITTLNTLLQDLVDAIKGISVTVPGVDTGPSTVTGTVSSGSQSALAAVATAIEGLLE